MHTLVALAAALWGVLFSPPAGRHHVAAPLGNVPGVPAAHSVVETKGRPRTRRVKARRVRRYARAIPVLDFDALPAGGPDVPDPVRPYVRLWEQKREAQRVEADRCGIADLAAAGGAR
ncbi:hypothetical protein [Streptomonospora alba]|uniref:hypothetical protein n=1 Tax=Streptomonospora alba TaxID=183763 RepID=UPI0012EE003E|nr:hypothetical protein [Streptomonospora alba]